MIIYSVNDEKKVNDIIMLIKLNEQVTRVKWSKSIGNLPDDIKKSLSNIEQYVETKIEDLCDLRIYCIDDSEELILLDLIKKNPNLKDTLGLGVIKQGEQKDKVLGILKKTPGLEKLFDAITENDNIVMF